MKIKFTESVTIPASDHAKEIRFKKGSIHDLSEPSAYRWVRRNKAVYYVEEVAAAVVVSKVKLDRPMMAEKRVFKPEEIAVPPSWSDKPKKKRGRPKKAKEDPPKVLGTAERKIAPALPVKGSGTNGGPGWDDV